MMLDRIVSQKNACIDAIDASKNLDESDKILFRDLINDAANGTNGLSHDEKLQNVSETVFSLVMLNILDRCNGGPTSKVTSLYQMISDCKWALCVVCAILGAVLIITPEIAPLIAHAFGK